jgi:hypothetical protein
VAWESPIAHDARRPGPVKGLENLMSDELPIDPKVRALLAQTITDANAADILRDPGVVKFLAELKQGPITGRTGPIENQQLRLFLTMRQMMPDHAPTATMPRRALEGTRRFIGENGVVDPNVAKLLAEEITDANAADTLHRLLCLLAVEEPAAAMAADQGQTIATLPKRVTVNDRMGLELLKNPESRGWTADQWATHLDCGHSTVVECDQWKGLQVYKTGVVIEKKRRKRTDRN